MNRVESRSREHQRWKRATSNANSISPQFMTLPTCQLSHRHTTPHVMSVMLKITARHRQPQCSLRALFAATHPMATSSRPQVSALYHTLALCPQSLGALPCQKQAVATALYAIRPAIRAHLQSPILALDPANPIPIPGMDPR
jgi:hypothetical protein